MRTGASFSQILSRTIVSTCAVLSLTLSLLPCPPQVLASDALRKIDVIQDLRFRSFSSDGPYFIFTRSDATGNKAELVYYDLRQKKPVFVIPDLPHNARFFSTDDRHAFVIDGMHSKQVHITIIEKEAPHRRATVKLEGRSVREAIKGLFIIDKRLYVIQPIRHKSHDSCLMYDAKTFELLGDKNVEKSRSYQVCGDKIVGIGNPIVVYDRELNPIHHMQNELQCQLGMSGTLGGRLFFSDMCGKIYEYMPKDNVRRLLFDLGKLDLPSGLHRFAALKFDIGSDGLLVAMHSNKETYPKLIDTRTGRVLATLPMPQIPNHVILDGNTLYFVFGDWLGRNSRIEVYQINRPMLNSDSLYEERLATEHAKALELYRSTKDCYRAIDVLETADVVSIVKDQRQVKDSLMIHVLNDYAYFLSLTYERYREAIPLLERVIRLPPERATAYVNLADTYYKVYQYDDKDDQALKKANSYYEQYKQLMAQKGQAKDTLHRTFSADSGETVLKKLPSGFLEFDLWLARPLFLKDRIFVSTQYCHSSRDIKGPAVRVYNRDDYTLVKELETIACDDEQQDSIELLQVQKNKLFVRTGYRYEDDKRPNLFVFDLTNLVKVAEQHEQAASEESNASSEESNAFGLDTSPASTEQASQLETFIRSGRKLEHVLGRYQTNNSTYLVTIGREEEKKFHVYNLATLERQENIDLTRPKARFTLFDRLDKVAITYHTAVKTIIEIFDIADMKGRTILSLENDAGGFGARGPVIRPYKNYLIIAHRRNLIFYDAKAMQIAKLIRHVLPEQGEGKAGSRISNLLVDHDWKRLLVFSRPREFNGFLDIGFLK